RPHFYTQKNHNKFSEKRKWIKNQKSAKILILVYKHKRKNPPPRQKKKNNTHKKTPAPPPQKD
ncbi:hypothetical protein, partial [Salmonella enterica]|uniref:hypothetical protein n=1 Tax=Salmonella enterica TaxID=28901 RepID=UPI001F3B238F